MPKPYSPGVKSFSQFGLYRVSFPEVLKKLLEHGHCFRSNRQFSLQLLLTAVRDMKTDIAVITRSEEV